MTEMEINNNVDEIMTKANTLIEALPYIRRFNGATIIVKYGGSAMLDDQLKMNVIKDVALLKLVGMRPIIVHGGGKEISKWVKLSGKEPEFYNGLRVTDKETMNVAEIPALRWRLRGATASPGGSSAVRGSRGCTRG